MIARFFWGASLAYTATVRHCILLAALIAVVTMFFGGSSAHAGIGETYHMDAPAQTLPSAIHVAHKPITTKSPCKRHKAHAHHDCYVCLDHVSVAPASRTRPILVSPKIKLVVADTLADRLAQAEAQASAQLILADSESDLLRSESAGVIARTGRLRN